MSRIEAMASTPVLREVWHVDAGEIEPDAVSGFQVKAVAGHGEPPARLSQLSLQAAQWESHDRGSPTSAETSSRARGNKPRRRPIELQYINPEGSA